MLKLKQSKKEKFNFEFKKGDFVFLCDVEESKDAFLNFKDREGNELSLTLNYDDYKYLYEKIKRSLHKVNIRLWQRNQKQRKKNEKPIKKHNKK